MMKVTTMFGAAVLLAATNVATGAAAEPRTIRSVHYADLDLQSPGGIAALERRLDRAARTMCATDVAPAGPALDDARNACIAQTLAGTRSSIDAAVRVQRRAMVQTAAAQ